MNTIRWVELYNSFNKNDTEKFSYVSCKFKTQKTINYMLIKQKSNLEIGQRNRNWNKWGHYSTLIIEDFVY